jgi:anaerobic selenocysteine-containing dehydrogenase
MGITDPAVLAPDEDLVRAAIGGDHPALAGVTFERLQAEGFVRMGFPTPYLPFAGGFPTPSGRFEFRSRDAVIAGLPELPDYVPPAEAVGGDARHPLALVAPADHHFLNSVFASSPAHLRRAGAPVVSLHPDDAAARGIVEGDRVRVHNDRGAFEAAAVLDGRARVGLVVTTKGWWPKLVGGANANATVAERDSDLGHGAVYHDNRVEVTPVGLPASSTTAGDGRLRRDG